MIRPAPGGEAAQAAETGTGSVHEHPMPEGQAPDLKSLQAQIQSLTTALAESERKRVEERAALAALYEWHDRDGSVGGANDVFSEHRALLAREEAEHGR